MLKTVREPGLHVHAHRRHHRRADGELLGRRHGHLQHRLHADRRGDVHRHHRHGDLRRRQLDGDGDGRSDGGHDGRTRRDGDPDGDGGHRLQRRRPSSATGTITNDDTDVTVAVAPSSVAEDGATNLVYTFTRTGVTTAR